MKTKTLFSWNILFLTIGSFLLSVPSSNGMYKGFWRDYAKEKVEEAARERAEAEQRERALMELNDPANQSGSVAHEDLNSGNAPREFSPEEEEEIQRRLNEHEALLISSGYPTLTEEERLRIRADIIAAIASEKAAVLLASDHASANRSALAATKRLSLGSTSSEGKSSHPSTPPGSIRKEHSDSDASEELERLSKEHHSDGSTSGEDSHHTTPEKRLPSAPPLPDMTEVERLQEEVRKAKEEMDRAEDFWKNKKENAHAYAIARNNYLKLEEQLYFEQKKANSSIAHSLALTLCERHIPFVLHAIAQTEEQLLKYGKGQFGTILYINKCDSELSQIKEHILPLWNHYLFLARERYKTKEALTFPDPYIATEKEQTTLRQLQQELQTFKEALPRLKDTFLSWQTRKSELEENLHQAFTETSRKLQLAVAQAKKAVDDFDRNHPVVGFGFTQRSRDLQAQQNALVATYNRAVRGKNEYLNPSPGYSGYCDSASDHLSSSDLRAADREMQGASRDLQDQERKIRDKERKVSEFAEIIKFHPELRGSEDVAYFKQPLQEQFNHYWRALNALITFGESLPLMLDKYCGNVISREAEEYYQRYAPILVSYKATLLAPQEKNHPERFVAHGMTASEIASLATERKKAHDGSLLAHRAVANRSNSYTPSYLPASSSASSISAEIIRREQFGRQQQQNAIWNAQQSAMAFGAMNMGGYYQPNYRL